MTVKLVDVEPEVTADELVVSDAFSDEIKVSGAGSYERGTLMMSDGMHHFVTATESGYKTAKELCILGEDIEVSDEDSLAITTGYFEGVFKAGAIILPEGMIMDEEERTELRQRGIYVR